MAPEQHTSDRGRGTPDWLRRQPFLFLTVTLLLLILAMPLLHNSLILFITVQLLFALVLLVGLASITTKRKIVWVLFTFWLISFIWSLTNHWLDGQGPAWAKIVGDVVIACLIIGCLATLVGYIFRVPTITANALFAATAAYVILALFWAVLFVAVNHVAPGSIAGAGDGWPDMIYFSLVTITTLGYGDLTPVTPFCRMLAAVEAVTGQLYLAVLVAWLMGLLISQARKRQQP